MKDYLISKNVNKNSIYVTGIPISDRFQKKYDKNEILQEFNLSREKFTVLFFGGGEFGLGKTRTSQIFEDFVRETKIHNIQIIAISGKNPKMKDSFEEIVTNNKAKENVVILEFTNKVPELMSISNIVVTKPGGLTTSESLASHLPMVVINPIPGQEEENAEFLESKGIAVWIKKNDNSEKIIENLLSDKEKLEIMKENTKILSKPNSTNDICNILLSR